MLDELPSCHDPQQGVSWAGAIFPPLVALPLPGTHPTQWQMFPLPRMAMSRVTLAPASCLSWGGNLLEQWPLHKGLEHLAGCGTSVCSCLLGRMLLLHGSGSIVITAGSLEPAPTHLQHCESSLCGGGAGWPHKHLWQLGWGGKQGYEGSLENDRGQPGAGHHHSGMGSIGAPAQQQPATGL